MICNLAHQAPFTHPCSPPVLLYPIPRCIWEKRHLTFPSHNSLTQSHVTCEGTVTPLMWSQCVLIPQTCGACTYLGAQRRLFGARSQRKIDMDAIWNSCCFYNTLSQQSPVSYLSGHLYWSLNKIFLKTRELPCKLCRTFSVLLLNCELCPCIPYLFLCICMRAQRKRRGERARSQIK